MFTTPFHTGNIYFYERHSFFCSVCKQRFLTEKNFHRHITSRKHIRQMQYFRVSGYRVIGRPHGNVAKLDLLPNEVIEELIEDLTNQINEKENFFNEIELVDDNQLIRIEDSVTCSAPVQQISVQKPSFIIKKTPIFDRPKLIDLSGVSPTSPCLECFQSLDSQQHFNEHMLKAHFNMSIDNDN